ncbi:MAG: hypothetical protein KGQ46_14455 [Hyphomicrobiales bacterium]|nr:hypothetical protein [Hyphomicrobiales bacterium]MDE2114457.1 hypothetical protein [Hyphomicrobiales bacterium]
MTDTILTPSRRNLLKGVAASGPAALLAATGFAATAKAAEVPTTTSGPLTYYAEFRVAQPFKPGFDGSISEFAKTMQQRGALAVTIKQMVGDSTMVKNYPESYKGLLRNAYAEAAKAGTLPLFYSLFVRFESAKALAAAKPDAAFDTGVLPHLHGAMMQNGKPVATPAPMAVYRGIFQTVAAGDRKGIYTNEADIVRFLAKPVDAAAGNSLITVGNHAYIADHVMGPFEQKVVLLLKEAQETFQPTTAADGIGQAGAADNRFYRKAVSTEILRKSTPDGQHRAYIMHGIWDSVWDHENSHLDPRFKTASGPVGAMVDIGPVEPFYTTQMTLTKM